MPSRVLFVHPNDIGVSGGTIAMHRLRGGLQTIGVESQILCSDRQLTSNDSVRIPTPRSVRTVETLLHQVTKRIGLNNIHRIGSFALTRLPAYRAASLLDVNCLHGDYLNYLALPALSRHKPVVLSLHDMYPITGHCWFSFDCQKWQSGCGRCPYPDEFPAVWRDNTRLEWKLKRWSYGRSSMVAVAPSRWLADAAARSPLAGIPVHHIPYGVPTDRYRPDPSARQMLDLPADRPIILSVAVKIGEPRRDRKGGDLLMSALEALPDRLRSRALLLVMGKADPEFLRRSPLETVSLGYISDEAQKARIYAAADCVVCSTRADNLPLVVLESLACGTPVAAFAVGGVPEAVREGITGALAIPEDPGALSQAIARVLEAPDQQALRNQCRQVALDEYDLRLQARRTASMYETVLADFARRAEPHTNGSHRP